MPETLLSPSNILLFGRVVEDLDVVIPNRLPIPPAAPAPDPRHGPFATNRTGPNLFLEAQLIDPTAAFARIYGFSYEGRYYDLPWPALFMVHGPGQLAETLARSGAAAAAAAAAQRVARAPDDPDRSGLGAQDFSFADNLMVWSYDRADLSIRLDLESGSFEQILLDVVLGGGGGPSVSGVRARGPSVSGVRVRGVRVAGVRARGGRDGESGD